MAVPATAQADADPEAVTAVPEVMAADTEVLEAMAAEEAREEANKIKKQSKSRYAKTYLLLLSFKSLIYEFCEQIPMYLLVVPDLTDAAELPGKISCPEVRTVFQERYHGIQSLLA